MIEYDGITFITDQSMRREVTAYPSALPMMDIDRKMRDDHEKAIRLLHGKPELSTSHTVIVIDNSGSMLSKKNNVHLYRDSQNAAFSMTELEFVAEQMFNETAVNTDLVSLVTFSSDATVDVERESIDWLIYNKSLYHRNSDRFVHRRNAPEIDALLAGSNYLPAMEQAHRRLVAADHDNCAPSLFFFTDGQPTDHKKLRIPIGEATERMCNKITLMARQFGENFTVTIVGLGDPGDDFSILHDMVSAAVSAGAKGTFEFCNKTAQSISSAITSLVSSTTESRTAIMEGRLCLMQWQQKKRKILNALMKRLPFTKDSRRLKIWLITWPQNSTNGCEVFLVLTPSRRHD